MIPVGYWMGLSMGLGIGLSVGVIGSVGYLAVMQWLRDDPVI